MEDTSLKPKEKKNSAVKKTRKRTRLDILFGCFKGKIFYDDAIFNLGVRTS